MELKVKPPMWSRVDQRAAFVLLLKPAPNQFTAHVVKVPPPQQMGLHFMEQQHEHEGDIV